MNIKCNVIVDAWLGQILQVVKLEFFYSLKQCQTSSCILSKCLCQIKSAHRGDEGGVINEDIMVFQEQDFFIQSSPDAFEGLP